jgi:putative glutamine amidotransferase
MKPFIGITSDFNPGKRSGRGDDREPTYFLRARYAQAVEDLGGVPLVFPPTEDPVLQLQFLSRIDGLLVTGSGPDLDPAFYGQPKKARFKTMDPIRARFELAMVQQSVARNLPVLGICGGLQSLNVALGGTLIQDIQGQIPGAKSHRQKTAATLTCHAVRILPKTRLSSILGSGPIQVNSSHHQAPEAPARGLIVNAVAPDGVIEGLEAPGRRFVLGVQWHPEYLYRNNAASRRLIAAFLRASNR